jgi:hypothetical protein
MTVDSVVRRQQRMPASFSRGTVWRCDQFNDLLDSANKLLQKLYSLVALILV